MVNFWGRPTSNKNVYLKRLLSSTWLHMLECALAFSFNMCVRVWQQWLICKDVQPRAWFSLTLWLSPLRHCYPIYVSLQLDIWRRSAPCMLCVFVCVCVCQNADCRVFSRGWGGAEKLDAGKRTTERESFLFLVVPRWVRSVIRRLRLKRTMKNG